MKIRSTPLPTSGVWVFVGDRGRFPSAVFDGTEAAREWIKKHGLTGTLTLYPLNQGIFDWAITNEYFEVKAEKEITPSFVQNFSSAYQEHFHFEDGREAGAA